MPEPQSGDILDDQALRKNRGGTASGRKAGAEQSSTLLAAEADEPNSDITLARLDLRQQMGERQPW